MKTTSVNIPKYYFLVMGLLLLQMVFTVYHGGLAVGNGAKISRLEKQKQTIASQAQALQTQLASSHSLVNIQASDLYHQFQPMAQVLTVKTSDAVASR